MGRGRNVSRTRSPLVRTTLGLLGSVAAIGAFIALAVWLEPASRAPSLAGCQAQLDQALTIAEAKDAALDACVEAVALHYLREHPDSVQVLGEDDEAPTL